MNFAATIDKKISRFDEDKYRDNIILVLTAILLSVLTSILFYLQTLSLSGAWESDLPTHISYALYMDNYSILFALIKWLYTVTNYMNYSIGLLEGLTVGFAFLVVTITIEKLFSHSRWLSMAISFCLLFLTNMYVPGLFPRFYRGSLISQPWHNITYNAMRPFAVLTMLFFASLHKIYREEKRISLKYWLLTCVSLVISAMLKPNFLMGFAPALLVYLLIDFFGKRNTFKNEFLLGCVVLPAIAILPIQAGLLFDDSNGLIFGPSIFFFTEGVVFFIMKFVSSLLLPAIVYIYNRRRLDNGAGIAAWGFFWVTLQAMFIMESGIRQTHGNFLWGCEILGYILFMYTFSMLIRDFKEYRAGVVEKTTLRKVYLIVGFILTAVHLITGFYYFSWVARGYFFYI